MGFEDTRTHRAILTEKYLNLQKDHKIAQAELRFLSKGYISYLIYKGWTKKKNQIAEAEKIEREELIKQQKERIEEFEKQVFRLEKKIKGLEEDVEDKSKNLVDYERRFGLYQLEKKELVDKVAAAQDEIEFLRNKYVNLTKIDAENQYNYLLEPGVLSTCVT